MKKKGEKKSSDWTENQTNCVANYLPGEIRFISFV